MTKRMNDTMIAGLRKRMCLASDTGRLGGGMFVVNNGYMAFVDKLVGEALGPTGSASTEVRNEMKIGLPEAIRARYVIAVRIFLKKSSTTKRWL